MGTGGRRMGQSPKEWLGRCEVRGTKRKKKTYITCAARLIVGGDCQSCSRRFSFFFLGASPVRACGYCGSGGLLNLVHKEVATTFYLGA